MHEFPSSTKAESSTGLLFMRSYNKWHSEIKKQLKSLGITHPQFVVLTSISYLSLSNDEVSQVMISKISGMDVMSISQIVNILEKNQFISRKEHSKDTRAKSVTLTQKTKTTLNSALPLVEAIDAQFFGSLKNKEKHFIELLHELYQYDFE